MVLEINFMPLRYFFSTLLCQLNVCHWAAFLAAHKSSSHAYSLFLFSALSYYLYISVLSSRQFCTKIASLCKLVITVAVGGGGGRRGGSSSNWDYPQLMPCCHSSSPLFI
jgi:hypothetical protein